MTLARKHIRRTTAAERNERRQRAEDKRALRANLQLVRAGLEPTVEAAQAVDPKFLAFVHTLPCCAEGLPGHNCRGPMEADHVGARGHGDRCIDSESIPLRKGCHEDRHASEGPFSLEHWTFDERRTWLDEQIANTQRAYALHRDHDADRDHPPGQSVTRSRSSERGHLSAELAALLPQLGTISIGDPVSLGGREGAVAELFPDVHRMAVRWLDGEVTEEPLPS